MNLKKKNKYKNGFFPNLFKLGEFFAIIKRKRLSHYFRNTPKCPFINQK